MSSFSSISRNEAAEQHKFPFKQISLEEIFPSTRQKQDVCIMNFIFLAPSLSHCEGSIWTNVCPQPHVGFLFANIKRGENVELK